MSEEKMDVEVVAPEEERNEQVYPQELAAVAAGIAKTDAMLSFLNDEYSYESEIVAIRAELSTSAEHMFYAGCRLLRMKEHETPEHYSAAIEKLGIERHVANRLINTAAKFVSDNGSVKYPKLAQQSVSKLYELALMDDEDLKELEEGKPVANIQVEDIDRMTVRELRKAVRDHKADKKALQDVINSKSAKIDELEVKAAKLEAELREMKEGKKAEPIPLPDTSELEREAQMIMLDSATLYQKIKALADRYSTLATGTDEGDSMYRAAYESFMGIVHNCGLEMERAEDYADRIAKPFSIPADGFRSEIITEEVGGDI